ncbi:hypothetical protein HML84_04935 [Alcanivorax sp. IO_7]|nr:hypothetical protein HML84_04935 [Alcanivorax sp. IO_7]
MEMMQVGLTIDDVTFSEDDWAFIYDPDLESSLVRYVTKGSPRFYWVDYWVEQYTDYINDEMGGLLSDADIQYLQETLRGPTEQGSVEGLVYKLLPGGGEAYGEPETLKIHWPRRSTWWSGSPNCSRTGHRLNTSASWPTPGPNWIRTAVAFICVTSPVARDAMVGMETVMRIATMARSTNTGSAPKPTTISSIRPPKTCNRSCPPRAI